MKIANIALLGILALGTTTPALAEDGFDRALKAASEFKQTQERIHGKDNQATQVASQKSATTDKGNAESNHATKEC
ncbi:hypothetical protein [Aquipseudomonas alcaligenes]|uniref:Secreted protein n=1 Tax=Aquipseudomonas alcaligenes (strain ATCC 14909 / DSM 50342 / CCUG 1425 / JCM 20561 / NBRC 14159 / NCIMB 9945 / NCTC 10367 / 1577) TaxID=1215092 RepID=U2Z732_AQUA1|nr:hypothetical protein [Pseudomonas alcaligenes]GAD63556.1 hypothetical protein PA6_025_00390 [Pseudomonas alcaligenes NBRC 14159]